MPSRGRAFGLRHRCGGARPGVPVAGPRRHRGCERPRKPWIMAAGFPSSARPRSGGPRPVRPTASPSPSLPSLSAPVAVEIAAVFNNAMMPSLVPPERLGRLSGTGWAMGYAGGLLARRRAGLPHRPRRASTTRPRAALRARPRRPRGRPITGPLRPPGSWSSSCRSSSSPGHSADRRSRRDAVIRGSSRSGPPSRTREGTRASGGSSSPTWSIRTPSSPLRVRRHLRCRSVRLGDPGTRHLRYPAHRHRHGGRAWSAAASTTGSAPSR